MHNSQPAPLMARQHVHGRLPEHRHRDPVTVADNRNFQRQIGLGMNVDDDPALGLLRGVNLRADLFDYPFVQRRPQDRRPSFV